MIYYNKTVLIGQRINIDYENNSSKQAIARLVPWEEQGLHIKEKIYSLFFEAMSELYFSESQNNKFKKEFERFRRRRLREKTHHQRSLQVQKDLDSNKGNHLRSISSLSFEERELKRNRDMLEKLFKYDIT